MNLVYRFKTLKEIVNAFGNEKQSHYILGQNRWADGVVKCAHCEHEDVYVYKDGITYKCKGCVRQFTARTNTFMHGSKVSVQDWMVAMWLVLHKKGISSVQLGKDLGVTQKTAWFMLQKLRIVMGYTPAEQLEGVVEIDEAFIGGASRFKHKNKRPKYNPGRSWSDKVPVIGMLQRGGRVMARSVQNVEMLTIRKQTMANVKPGSTIMGDGFQGYKALQKHYDVKCIDHSKGWYVDGEVHTNTIEGFWSQLKKGLKGTYHQVSKQHLNNYLNEFVFKYNNRNLTMEQQIKQLLWQMNLKITNKFIKTHGTLALS